MDKIWVATMIFGNHAGEHQHRNNLRREGLSGGNGNFWASVNISTTVNFTSDSRTNNVNNTEGLNTALLDFAETSKGVSGFARLRNN